MDVIPEPKTDPNSAPWAKAVTKHVKNSLTKIDNMQANIKNTNLTVGAQIALLQQQVADLQDRQSYYAEILEPLGNPLALSVNNTSANINKSLSFTLTSTRRVLVRITADVILYVTETGNGVAAWPTVNLDGTLVNSLGHDMWDGPAAYGGVTSGTSLLLNIPVTGSKFANVGTTMVSEHVYLSLPPDTYTLTGSIYYSFTGTGSGAVNSYHESFFAQVLD